MPRNLNDSTAVTVLSLMASGGRAGGFLLKSTIIGCAVVGVQGEEQWGENSALRSSSDDYTGAGCVFSQPH